METTEGKVKKFLISNPTMDILSELSIKKKGDICTTTSGLHDEVKT